MIIRPKSEQSLLPLSQLEIWNVCTSPRPYSDNGGATAITIDAAIAAINTIPQQTQIRHTVGSQARTELERSAQRPPVPPDYYLPLSQPVNRRRRDLLRDWRLQTRDSLGEFPQHVTQHSFQFFAKIHFVLSSLVQSPIFVSNTDSDLKTPFGSMILTFLYVLTTLSGP